MPTGCLLATLLDVAAYELFCVLFQDVVDLVQEVVDSGQELARAIAIAETITSQAPIGVRSTIASARKSLTEEAAARALLPEIQRLMATDDAREGLMSFLERRAAKFTGK